MLGDFTGANYYSPGLDYYLRISMGNWTKNKPA